ncbi:taurine catabolism dioxygenase TauD, TfdA family protein [Aspergillus steynii IBT 23096]|uniref:Taurine catabolism dioxygenase TauD, TfdA family protein n=1 Tax=Aspergillus steynii IBT 23096 TaxID=1392250 RepID=A0A2I2GI06_9EURO|nr:taurine catabolism dioxygenase TauD, TfdA family protein [Aspergillus steynii IBT 23096]PLB52516.1 taurine catabolism dioxygenase TauD, TfdA family protein [Aspergillus steynii IBT 23096]
MTAPIQIPTPNFTLESFDLPSTNQRILGPPHPPNTAIPLALRPASTIPTLDTIIHDIQTLQHNQLFTKYLSRHGTLLFRGLPIHNASDFSRFAHAFGYRPHEIIGIVVDRPVLAPNVAPANESPKEILIYNHNESPQVPHAPEYIFFYGHRSPADGGETPISSSLELFQRAQRELPTFIAELADKGILSKVTYTVTPQYKGGATLRQAFGKHILDSDDEDTQRRKVEAQIKRYNRGEYTTWEWTDEGTLVLTHRLPAIRTQVGTNLPALFTGLAAYYRNVKVNGRGNAAQQVYGDGTAIPEEYLERLARITDEIRVLHRWEEGDVLVYDNVVAQHGREPWRGEQADRVVMASLFDGEVPGVHELLENHKNSIIGLVVEFVVAIDEARVRFTDDAFFLLLFLPLYNIA